MGDTVQFTGAVEAVDAGAGTVTLDLWGESERGRTVTSKAVVVLAGDAMG